MADSSYDMESIEIPEEHYYADKKKDNKFTEEESGLVRYNIADSMVVGISYTVNVRISKQKDTSKIIINMPQGKMEYTRVGSEMAVKLLDEEGGDFDIKALDSETQSIEDDNDYTQWEWTVKPLKCGTHKLKMLITIKQRDLTKDVPVFEKDIYIKSSLKYTIKNILENNWQMLLTSILIPFMGFLFHLFYKEKRKKKPNRP